MDLFSSAVFSSFISKRDSSRTLYQLITDNEYPYEMHHYETEDGYINKCVRISGKINFNINKIN